MSVSIISGQQLLQQIEQGSNFTLDAQGGIRTQSGFAKFIQNIGDAFRSLTEAGRTAIAQRNERLQNALTEMLRNEDAVPNLADTAIIAVVSPRHEAMTTLCAYNAARAAVADLPAEIQKKTVKAVMNMMTTKGMLQGSPAEARATATDLVQKLTGNPACMSILTGTTRPAIPENIEAMKETIQRECGEFFLKPSQQAEVDTETSIHKSYPKDFLRGSIQSINGQAPDSDYNAQLIALVPDPKIRTFVSMMAAQSGIEGAVWEQLMRPTATRANDMPSIGESLPFIKDTSIQHTYDLSVENDVMNIRLTYVTSYDLILLDGEAYSDIDAISLGMVRHEVTAQVPLDQDMENRILPDFTITDLTFTSLS